jgi:CRP-like cAMP-binding protein
MGLEPRPLRSESAVKPTQKDAAVYASAIRRIEPIDDAGIALAFSHVRVRTLGRGEYLLRGGQMATEVAVVVSGLLREHFVLADGTERTKAFVAEGELTGSLADLLSQAPSRAFIVAEEPARLLVTSFETYRALGNTPGWDRFALKSAQALLMRKAEREFELLGLDAAARYAVFADRFPGLEARVAAKHVASYLGITPVHLSRLRRRRRERTLPAARATRLPRSPKTD